MPIDALAANKFRMKINIRLQIEEEKREIYLSILMIFTVAW